MVVCPPPPLGLWSDQISPQKCSMKEEGGKAQIRAAEEKEREEAEEGKRWEKRLKQMWEWWRAKRGSWMQTASGTGGDAVDPDLALVARRVQDKDRHRECGVCVPHGRAEPESNCIYCMSVYDRVDNWIIKAILTKAPAPPPAERRCQRSVTSRIYVHWSLWWGRGFLLKAFHHQLLHLSFTCRKWMLHFYFILFYCGKCAQCAHNVQHKARATMEAVESVKIRKNQKE